MCGDERGGCGEGGGGEGGGAGSCFCFCFCVCLFVHGFISFSSPLALRVYVSCLSILIPCVCFFYHLFLDIFTKQHRRRRPLCDMWYFLFHSSLIHPAWRCRCGG